MTKNRMYWEMIKKMGHATSQEIAEKFKVSPVKAQNVLSDLKKQGKIKAVPLAKRKKSINGRAYTVWEVTTIVYGAGKLLKEYEYADPDITQRFFCETLYTYTTYSFCRNCGLQHGKCEQAKRVGQ